VLRINRETDYAIRVILALADHPAGEIVPSAEIRQRMQLPESLSLQIISQLSKLHLVNSYPGRNGGIQLAHPPSKISLLNVIEAIQGPIILSECLEDGHTCGLAPGCPVQCYWIGLQNRIEADLAGVSFQELLEKKLPIGPGDVQ
jgi:Rrf2 family iron-sulfur cluster assembly transcriptional regulator